MEMNRYVNESFKNMLGVWKMLYLSSDIFCRLLNDFSIYFTLECQIVFKYSSINCNLTVSFNLEFRLHNSEGIFG